MSEIKIYTKKGDDGTTSLWYGGRVPKSDIRTTAYGDVDEAIATIAVARAEAERPYPEIHGELLEVQRCMFIGCASLATDPEHMHKLVPGVTLMTDDMTDWLEQRIDWYKEHTDLPPKFIIPGGTRLSAELDVARTVMRRAERSIVELKLADGLPDETVLRFVNRASDFLFMLARYTDKPDPVIFEGRDAAKP